MNSEFFNKEINLSVPITKAFDDILEIAKIKEFSLTSENKILNKIILEFRSTYRIEVLLKKISDTQTRISISILDKNNSYYKPSNIASNICLNFENGITAVIENKTDTFKAQPFNNGGQGCLQLIILLVAVGGLGYVLYTLIN